MEWLVFLNFPPPGERIVNVEIPTLEQNLHSRVGIF